MVTHEEIGKRLVEKWGDLEAVGKLYWNKKTGDVVKLIGVEKEGFITQFQNSKKESISVHKETLEKDWVEYKPVEIARARSGSMLT